MIGIDSLGLRFPDYPLDDVIIENFHQGAENIGEENQKDIWTFESNYYKGISINFIYRTSDYGGIPSLFIYFSSIARLAFGNNYTPFPDVESAIKVVNDSLAPIPYIPKIGNVHNARLYRLDVFCHYDVGIENMENILEVIYRSDYPHRTRGPYLNHDNESYDVASNNGISFSTPSKKTKTNFYDKFEQCLDPKTIGYLRHEIQLSSARVIEDALRVEKPVFTDINQQIVERLFTTDIETLRLDSPIVNNHYSEILLKKKYGSRTGSGLFCLMLYLTHHKTIEKKQMADSLGITSHTLQIKLNMITEAGISPYILDEDTFISQLSEKRSLIG